MNALSQHTGHLSQAFPADVDLGIGIGSLLNLHCDRDGNSSLRIECPKVDHYRLACIQRGLRQVVSLAWPIVVGMISFTAMGVTDTLLVGRLGTTELAAVGLATTAFFLVNSFFLGALQGVKVLSAQATGASNEQAAAHTAWLGILLALPFGVLLALGQSSDLTIFPEGTEVTEGDKLIGTLQTPVFGVGDVATWDGTVTAAIGSGRRAAFRP